MKIPVVLQIIVSETLEEQMVFMRVGTKTVIGLLLLSTDRSLISELYVEL